MSYQTVPGQSDELNVSQSDYIYLQDECVSECAVNAVCSPYQVRVLILLQLHILLISSKYGPSKID